MLVITRKTDEGITISNNIEITVLEVNKDRVKIGISAPKEIRIVRNEILQTEEINRQASAVVSKQAIDKLLKKQ